MIGNQMARKPTGNPVGPPPKPIDWIQFEQLCALQCTQSEIASIFKVHPQTISDRASKQYGDDYSTIYKRFSQSGYCSLRRNQFVLSKTNASMAIWLGKIWLGQKDNQVEELQQKVEDVRSAIRELQEQRRREADQRPLLEDKQSLSHQGCGREKDKVRVELGAEGAME